VQFLFRGLKAASLLLAFSWFVGCADYSVQPAVTDVADSLSLSTTSLDFKSVVVGQTGTQTLQITNSGRKTVKLINIGLSSSQFTIAGATTPLTIQPASTLSLTVSFAPTAAGAESATLSIVSKSSVSPQVVSLAGTGEKAYASLVVSPSSINFGNETLKTVKSQTVTLQNDGDISLTIQSVAGAGGAFACSNLPAGTSIAAGQQLTFQVTFDPTVAGAASATISFTGSNISSPATLALSGDGVNASSSSPNPPSNPGPTEHSVELTWNPSSSPSVGYIVYRSESSSGPFNPLFGAPITVLSYDDGSVSDGMTYYYVVTAVDSAGNQSIESNKVIAAIP
jgi:hypothetical protein